MSGLVTAVNAIGSTAGRNDMQAYVLEEGAFLLETLEHAAEAGVLDQYAVTDGTLVRMTSSGSEPVSGNQMRVTEFTRTRITPEEPDPPYWMINFSLTAHTPDGIPYTRLFSEEIPTFPL